MILKFIGRVEKILTGSISATALAISMLTIFFLQLCASYKQINENFNDNWAVLSFFWFLDFKISVTEPIAINIF